MQYRSMSVQDNCSMHSPRWLSGASTSQCMKTHSCTGHACTAHAQVGYITGIISMGYVGRLGSLELSAYVLASSVYNVTGLSVALGLSTGMDTLAGSVGGGGCSRAPLVLLRMRLCREGPLGFSELRSCTGSCSVTS